MPKPEEVPKRNKTFLLTPEDVPKKNHVLEAPRPEDRKIFIFGVFFWYLFRFGNFLFFFGTSSGFGNKIVPKPEEVPEKKQNLFAKA